MASSLIISFLLAWLAVPLLAEHLLSGKDAEKEDIGAVFQRLLAGYQRLMQRLMKAPWLVLAGIAPLLIVGAVAYQQVGSGFMPHMDEGGFILDYRAPAGTSLTETDRLLRQVGDILRANPAVETYSRRTGCPARRRAHRGQRGRFFRATETLSQTAHRPGHGHGSHPHRERSPRSGSGNGAADGRPDR